VDTLLFHLIGLIDVAGILLEPHRLRSLNMTTRGARTNGVRAGLPSPYPMPSRLLLLALLPWLALAGHAAQPPATLRAAYANAFLIGAALDTAKVTGGNPRAGEIVARQFSCLTAENDMKWSVIHPEPDRYNFRSADAYVAFGARHTQAVIGHTLVWHNQTPPWVFLDDNGKPASRELLLRRLRDHIHTVVGRYKGRVKGWDVVNEAVRDGGPEVLRDSPWHRIIGDDFLDHAFRFAREADPRAELYYNDYGLFNREKRTRTLRMLRGLIARGVPIDGVGMQGHYQIDYPPVADIEQAILDFAALKLKVMVTELDVDMLPSRGQIGVADIARREDYEAALNPWVSGLPAVEQTRLAQRYSDLFALFLKHRKHITRVTFWGLDDGQSWLNNFPVPGRTNHPLLFDRQLKPKPAFQAVLEAAR
jgi:endo-1,4-beta-xylanase